MCWCLNFTFMRFSCWCPMIFCSGIMDARVGLLVLIVLATSWAVHGRNLLAPPGRRALVFEFSVMQLNSKEPEKGIQSLEEVDRNENVCTLCEEFTTEAVNFLKENKTQTEVIDSLHKTCSRVPLYKQECITLVDYYAPLFFSEVSLIEPGEFCRKVNLCEQVVTISRAAQTDSCELCHRMVAEALIRLKDPDTQIELIQWLLKRCDSVENYVKKCKRLVFEYGPLILANAEQFLETNDLCTTIHACDAHTVSGEGVSSAMEAPLVSDS